MDRASNAHARPLDRRGGRASTAGKSLTGMFQQILTIAQYRQSSESRSDRFTSFANTNFTGFCGVGFARPSCPVQRPNPFLKGAVTYIFLSFTALRAYAAYTRLYCELITGPVQQRPYSFCGYFLMTTRCPRQRRSAQYRSGRW